MNHRERFLATMRYQARDRVPLYDFSTWSETVPAWQEQGLPAGYTTRDLPRFFGLDAGLGGGEPPEWNAGIHTHLRPDFGWTILEDDGDVYTQKQADGVIVRKQRSSVSIPMHVGHTLVDRASWQREYRPRLDPSTPGRLPADWDAKARLWSDPARPHPVFVFGGSLFGWLRDWMGLENIALVVYDDPAWFEEMMTTIADLHVALLGRAFAAGARFDACALWEDMCYNAGPLLSPAHFRRHMVPHYRRITDLCRRHGCDVAWVDCDGKIDDLVPLWLEGGVNCMFPIEVGTWGADPVRFRREYGRDLLLMGGFDKHILARDFGEIEREIRRLAPLVEEGGFIPFCDHRVPPDVPLVNYIFYAETARRVWGHGVNLSPAEGLGSARSASP